MPAGSRRWTEKEVCRAILGTRALTVRDVAGGEEPFRYSSGSVGPGYVMAKSLVGTQAVFRPLMQQLALKLVSERIAFDHIIGNATGGMIPAYAVREAYQQITGRVDIEYVYVRGSRKQGGHGELVTGIEHVNRRSRSGEPASWIVVEDLINHAETSVNSLLLFRKLGFVADEAAALLQFDHPSARERLRDCGVRLTTLTTVPHLLEVAVDDGYFSARAADAYLDFIRDADAWQQAYSVAR